MATTTVKTPTVYTTEDFDYNKALDGALCIITNETSDPVSDVDESFRGVGIVKKDNPNRLVLVYKGISHYFKDNGENIDGSGFNLRLASIEAPTAVGPAVEDIVAYSITRSTDGTVTPTQITTTQNSVVVADLNPRDEFAIKALQSMMDKIPDPSVLSNAEMDLYCKAAYLWASNMMKNAANARATIFNDEGAPVEGEATISSLDNNTERLLNNLIEELKKNDIVLGTWAKTGQTSVKGEHTDAWVSTHSLGGTTYSTVAAAETAGWSWTTLEQYSERVDVQSMPDLSGTINIGASGLGRDASHPINELVHIGDSTNGKGETYGYPFYISGRSGTNHDTINVASTAAVSGSVTVSNASGSNLNVKSASGESVTIKGNSTYSDMNDVLRVNVVAGGGGGSTGGTVDVNSMPPLTGTITANIGTSGAGISGTPIYMVLGSAGTLGTSTNPLYISGSTTIDKTSIPTIQAGDTYTIQEVAVFKYDALGTSLYKVGMDALGVPVLSSVSSFPATPDRGHYYKLNTNSPIGTVDITLPAVINHNASVVGIIIYHFECSDNASFSVTSTSTVKFRGSNPGSTLAAGTYEVDCLDNGSYWVVGITKIV